MGGSGADPSPPPSPPPPPPQTPSPPPLLTLWVLSSFPSPPFFSSPFPFSFLSLHLPCFLSPPSLPFPFPFPPLLYPSFLFCLTSHLPLSSLSLSFPFLPSFPLCFHFPFSPIPSLSPSFPFLPPLPPLRGLWKGDFKSAVFVLDLNFGEIPPGG